MGRTPIRLPTGSDDPAGAEPDDSDDAAARVKATTGLASGTLGGKPNNAETFTEAVRQALYASKIVAYAQGFNQIQAGSAEYDWGITPGDLATIWRGGCIIRAKFLNRIKDAFDEDPNLPTLISAPYFRSAVENAIGLEIPTLCFLETLHPVNACRICVVEVEGARVLVPP